MKTISSDRVRNAVRALRATPGLRPLIDANGRPRLHIPDDNGQQDHLLPSDRVRAKIRAVYHIASSYQHHLTKGEVELVIDQLIDEAYREAMPSTEQGSSKLDQHPVLQAVILFMAGRPAYEGRTRELLEHLFTKEIQERLDNPDRFPSFTGQLTVELKSLKQDFAVEGLRVETLHKEDGSHTVITRFSHFAADAADGPGPVASAPSSAECPIRGNGLPVPDDTDAAVRREALTAGPSRKGGK